MRKILVLLLINIHLVGNTEAGQLFHLPRLLAHFSKHQANQEISFGEFLLMHYGGYDGTNTDNEEDRRLPCQNPANTSFNVVFSPMINDLRLAPNPQWFARNYSEELCVNLSSKHVQRILHPPRNG